MEQVDIQRYIELYNKSYSINRLKPLNNQTYKIFKSSKADIRVAHRSQTYENALAFTKIEHFLKTNEYFYLIPLTTIKGTIVGFIVRGVLTSDYGTVTRTLNYESKVPFMYGFDKTFLDYDRHKKCYPIIVCEGCKDCLTLKKIYPYVVANNTSSMGLNKAILRNITNKFLLVYDNDEAGINGMNRDKEILRDMGSYVDTVQIPEGYKDCTECLINTKTLEYNKEDFIKLSKQIKRKLKALYEI